MKNQRQGLSRRSFIAGVAGSSLMMSMGSLVSGCSSDQASKALASGDLSKVFSPNIWFEINGAGDVLIKYRPCGDGSTRRYVIGANRGG